jgi:hypothetical protein
MIEGTVAANGIGAQFAALAFARLTISDIERFLVGRQQDRARADGIVGHPRCHPGAAIIALEPQHGAVIEERKDRRAERNDRVARIGEIDTVPPVDDEIARLIVILAIEQRIDRQGTAVGRELDEAPATLLRAVKLAVRAERQPIDPVGIAPKLAQRLVDRIEAK